MPIGARGHIGIKKEVTWGTRDGVGDNDVFLPFISESLTPNIEEVLSAAQRAVADEPVSYQGERAFTGDVVLEVHPASIGHILRSNINVPVGPVAADATVLTLEDCEDAWDQVEGVNAGVISGIDSADKKKGSSAVKLTVTAGVAAGETLATELIASTDMHLDTALIVWVKCDKDCALGDLQFMLGEIAGCTGTPKFANIPALVAGVWTECTIPLGYMSRTDIAFVDGGGGDDTITTVAGDFVAAGFIVGDTIHVTGTDSSDGDYLLTGVAAQTLTMATATLPGDEAAGAAILNAMNAFNAVISVGAKMVVDKAECIIHLDDLRRVGAYTAGTAKKWTFTPRQTDFHADCPINPYTLEVYRDQGDAFQFLGGAVNTLAFSFGTAEKILRATCGIIAKDLGSVVKTNVGLETTNPFTWNQATITIDNVGASGTVDYDIESFGIKIDNACRGHYTCNQTVIPRKIIRDGYRSMPINFVTEFVDQTEFDLFILGTERAFQVKFVGVEVETGHSYTLQIDLPRVKYTAYPINIGGPGRLTCAVTGKAKYDVDLKYAVLFTLINKETLYNA